MIALVVSRADRASEHIGEQLLDLGTWETVVDDTRPDAEGGGTYYTRPGFELRVFDDLHLHLDSTADAFEDPSLLLFLSRHSGETGPLLSAHFTGNFGAAEYGGRAGELARACPNAQKAVVRALATHAPEQYDVGVECTHHGPSQICIPSMFVELGSGAEEWDDPAGARAVARAVLDIEDVPPDRTEGDATRHVVGFGGGHYAPRFERIIRETDWAVGHIGADWQLSAMGPVDDNRNVVRAAFTESAATLAVVDGNHPELTDAAADAGFRVVSETFLQVTTGVPRALVDRVESALGPVDNGLRFGDHARRLDGRNGVDAIAAADDSDEDDDTAEDGPPDATATPQFAVVALPDDLLAEALGADAETARAAVADNTVGYQTVENGRRPAGQAAIPTTAGKTDETGHTDAYDRLVAGLCDALRARYREVTREGDAVVARERAFDPEAAATLGVTEGPAFGRLANGESVEVDGREIPPEAVHTDRTIRFTV